jgi:hypothetical protein
MPLVAHLGTRWGECTMIVITFGFLLFRLLAERGRRKTLRVIAREAPAGTVVALGEGPGGPAMWVRVGDSHWPPPVGIPARVPRYRPARPGGGRAR